MLPIDHLDRRLARQRAAEQARLEAKRGMSAKDARIRAGFVLALAAYFLFAISLHEHAVLAARRPVDMPSSSRWVLTGRDSHSFDKQGLWIGCWKSTVRDIDHCRITDQDGTSEFDGDMLPMAGNNAVPDNGLQLPGKIDANHIWVRGVNHDLPVPVITLANGMQLVPITDREGLQRRLARGEWEDGFVPQFPAVAEQ